MLAKKNALSGSHSLHVERSNLDSSELVHGVTDGFAHQAHLSLFALVNRDFQGGPIALLFLVNHGDLSGRGLAGLDEDALSESIQSLLVGNPFHYGTVGLFNPVSWVHESEGEIAVVRDEDQSVRVLVQATNRLQLNAVVGKER